MADKEERILITKCSSHCHALRVSCDPFDDDDDMYCDKSGKWVRITEKECAKCKAPVLLGLSRSEAINRMAKAIEEKSEQMARECLNSDPYNNPWGAEDLAEAALNALLENKK